MQPVDETPTWTCEHCGATTTEPFATREFGIICPACTEVLPWRPWNHTAADIAYQPVSPRFPPDHPVWKIPLGTLLGPKTPPAE